MDKGVQEFKEFRILKKGATVLQMAVLNF